MLVFPKVGNYYIATAPPTETPKDSVDIIAVSHVISLETIVLDWQTQLVDCHGDNAWTQQHKSSPTEILLG